eukprot:scaffold329_cov92-Skeletonema_dohrnii-CCMP3373.AAC.8
MDVQDCEYYEARAKDVNLEDITSSEQNAAILARLRDNDPTFTSISIEDRPQDESDFVVHEGDSMGWLGYFVGRSKQVKELHIFSFPDNLKIDAFLRGLGHNRSIQSLHINIDLGEHLQSLCSFLRHNNNLSDLTFEHSIGLQCARNIAVLLGQQSSLKYLSFEDNNLGDGIFVEIATALSTQPQIEELNLFSSNIGRNGCVALGNALDGMRNPNLATLYLDHNGIDDEGLHALVEGLRKCRKLTSLRLSGNRLITGAGLRSLSTLLQSEHCRLEHLGVEQTNMDNDGVAVLAAGLARLPTLKKLDLASNHIGDQGLQALVGGLVNYCNIEHLRLAWNVFSVSGLNSLVELVKRATILKSLNVCGNAVDDEGLQCLVEGIVNCCSLQTLHLSGNHLITAVGLRSIAPFFQSDNCCLVKLELWGVDFGDEGAAALADGLKGNKSLTTLKFTSDGSGITERGWTAFSKLLCDTSSVNNTYLSNHTLERIGGYSMNGTTPDIVEYLTFNKLQKSAAAMCKILVCHPDIDIKPLFQWKLKCLPLVVTWLESARSYLGNVNESTLVFQCRQLSALYKFVRGTPQLAVDGFRGKKIKCIQMMSKKRKLDQTL